MAHYSYAMDPVGALYYARRVLPLLIEAIPEGRIVLVGIGTSGHACLNALQLAAGDTCGQEALRHRMRALLFRKQGVSDHWNLPYIANNYQFLSTDAFVFVDDFVSSGKTKRQLLERLVFRDGAVKQYAAMVLFGSPEDCTHEMVLHKSHDTSSIYREG